MDIDPGSQRGTKRRGRKAKPRKKSRTGPYAEGGFMAPGGTRWGPETKYFDTAFSLAVPSAQTWAGTEVTCTHYIAGNGATATAYTDSALNPSAQGTGYGQIMGNKYQLRRIRAKCQLISSISSDAADVLATGVTRVVLVLDTQPNGAQAQGEVVFEDLASAAASNLSFLAMGQGAGGRFQILKDKTYKHDCLVAGTDGASTLSTTRSGAVFKMNYNFKDPYTVQLKSGAATPAIAQLQNCNVFFLVHSTVSSLTFSGAARAYYSD